MTTTIEGASRRDGFTAPPERFTVVSDKKHPLYDPRTQIPMDDPELKALVASIYEFGVQKQILVVSDGDDLLVKDGNQRVRAALVANKLRRANKHPDGALMVPFRCVKSGEEQWVSEKATVNIHVRSPFAMQAGVAQRLEQSGKSREQIATAMGCSRTAVDNYLRYFDAAPKVQKAVEDGKLAADALPKLVKMTREKQVETLDTMMANGVTKGTPAKRAVSEARKGRPVPTKQQARRMRNQAAVQEVVDAMSAREEQLKPEGQHVLAALRWVLRQAEASEQCDDLAECLDEKTAENQE